MTVKLNNNSTEPDVTRYMNARTIMVTHRRACAERAPDSPHPCPPASRYWERAGLAGASPGAKTWPACGVAG